MNYNYIIILIPIRQFMQYVNMDKVKKSNSSCTFNIQIMNNRTDPELTIHFG